MLTIDAVTHLDRASHHRRDRDWLDQRWRDPTSRIVMLIDQKPVIDARATSTQLRLWSADEIAELGLIDEPSLFLGLDPGDRAWFAIVLTGLRAQQLNAGTALNETAIELRRLAMEGLLDRESLSLAGQARALTEWHRESRCCGRCGAATQSKDGGWRRQCWACGREQFPRTDPVVIMLPVLGDRCLLARGAHFPPALYSALAGFLEPGEDIERAVRREVLEEVGLRVGRVIYQESQPWPFPHSLMIGCRAEVEDDQLTIDPHEITEAFWVDRNQAAAMLAGTDPLGRQAPGRHAIARELLAAFVEDRSFGSSG